jgi:hypothetical protein
MVPEYFVERPVISMERSSGILSYGPYIISALLTEVPRAILQSCILLGIIPKQSCIILDDDAIIAGVVYIMHPLNPTTANTTFAFVCLMVSTKLYMWCVVTVWCVQVGTCAWQSAICACSVVSDSISVAYTVCFLILGA